MPAHRSKRCAAGRALFFSLCIASAFAPPGAAQLLSSPDHQPQAPIAAIAERLARQLLAANAKSPFILDLTLPGDLPSPLGVWLADQLSQALAQSHPELQPIPRSRWSSSFSSVAFVHDRNQLYAQYEQRAQSLGAQVLILGNFAAVPAGIGITLLATDHLSGGNSRYEILAEIPIDSEMQALLTSPLPQRALLQGAFKASVAGISSPVCEICPAPRYTYIAKAKKLQGIVIAQVWVAASGAAEIVKIVRAPHPALADEALRAVRTWHFKPARNVREESVPVVVDVALSFRLDLSPSPVPATVISKNSN